MKEESNLFRKANSLSRRQMKTHYCHRKKIIARIWRPHQKSKFSGMFFTKKFNVICMVSSK